ncbi:cation:proton antiporter [Massilia sp. DWR3-1-1]|uniref:cation:proton antiporter domain-containing protein n=1 Tax=Massilia sp. DWR3-1-1 TaxID=2804559 RepID=UPI003CFB7088
MQDHAFPFLREILLFLTLAGILMPLLQRLRINQVLGFLAVGAVVGPFGLGLLAERYPTLAYFTFPRLDGVNVLAELGVLFLMFMIGLELSAARLWAMRRWVFGGGTAQVLVSAALLGGALALFGLGWRAAVVLGLVLSLSSTAVVMQLMAARQTTTSTLGQAAFAILMLQDLAVVPLLILIGVLSGSGDGNPAMLAATTIAKAGLAIALIYLVGGRIVRPLFRNLVRHHQSDVFMALILLTTLGIAGISAAAGLSMALGALIAGVLLAETEFKHEIELMIEPFRGLLMGLFFMTVGMGTDVSQIARAPLLLAAMLLTLVTLKTAVTSVVLRRGGLPWGRAVEGGLLLAQGGEFAFIAVGYALAGHLIDGALEQQVMLVVTLSLFITPLLARLGKNIGDASTLRQQGAAVQVDGPAPHAGGHVIIAGYGRVGQMLGKLLATQHLPYLAFEADAVLVAALRKQGHPVHFGDAARAELLRRVQAGQARAIVLTMDHPQSSLQAVQGIRREFPDVPLFARARDEQQARLLKAAGATLVVPETLEASLQLSAFVLEAMGLDQAASDALIDRERSLFNAALSP